MLALGVSSVCLKCMLPIYVAFVFPFSSTHIIYLYILICPLSVCLLKNNRKSSCSNKKEFRGLSECDLENATVSGVKSPSERHAIREEEWEVYCGGL